MSEHILTILKRRLEDLASYGELDAETRRNALKEDLQYYVLDFVYHHLEYSKWVMYGGSALRIIHGLNRMSVDLDFEVPHPVTEKFLENLKKEIGDHFKNTYATEPDFMNVKITTNRGLLLRFNVGEDLSFGSPSKQVHLKIDLNHFVAPKTVTERRPINHDQLSFVIQTYNMAALMASKIAAIFLRGTRGVGEVVYEEKGRDIYDLLWYMSKKIVPDFDYLNAKIRENRKEIPNARALFDELTFQMNRVSNENLKQDLVPLFTDRRYIENWLESWLQNYFHLLETYKIRTITNLEHVRILEDLMPDNFYFFYYYNTEDGKQIIIRYALSGYWIDFAEGNLNTKIPKEFEEKIEFTRNGYSSAEPQMNKINQYAFLFKEKNDRYFKKANNVILGDGIATKMIRMTADNLNQKEQIVLNKSALLFCELDDLIK